MAEDWIVGPSLQAALLAARRMAKNEAAAQVVVCRGPPRCAGKDPPGCDWRLRFDADDPRSIPEIEAAVLKGEA